MLHKRSENNINVLFLMSSRGWTTSLAYFRFLIKIELIFLLLQGIFYNSETIRLITRKFLEKNFH